VPTALLETKLYVPRSRRGLVPRPRLSERLDRGTASTLVLVSAPAGFGKTTLVAEWLRVASSLTCRKDAIDTRVPDALGFVW
jgi:LuxR family transcriptional regulator, maltose regulon positive regulatory protein